MLKGFLRSAALWLLVCAAWSALPTATASTVKGEVVDIAAMDSLNATADAQSRKGVGKIIAWVLAIAGVGTVASGYHLAGSIGVGAGVATGFLPGIISSSFDAAPAATPGLTSLPGLLDAWWAPLMAALYGPLLLLRFLQDPVCLVSLALALLLCRQVRNGRQSLSLG